MRIYLIYILTYSKLLVTIWVAAEAKIKTMVSLEFYETIKWNYHIPVECLQETKVRVQFLPVFSCKLSANAA